MHGMRSLALITVWLFATGNPSTVVGNEPEQQAGKAITAFFEAFNAQDNVRLQSVMQYPHVFFGEGANVFVADEQFVTDFDALRDREDWKFSTLNSVKPVFTRPDKVHFLINFTRHNSAGEIYTEMDGLWIVTKKNGRWAVSARSY